MPAAPPLPRLRVSIALAIGVVLAALDVLPSAASAANPPNSFVIGWQSYTKTGAATQDRFITWRINSSGSLSSTPVYTPTYYFNPTFATPPGTWYSNDYDRSTTRRLQVTPDGRKLLAYGMSGQNYVLNNPMGVNRFTYGEWVPVTIAAAGDGSAHGRSARFRRIGG